MPDTRNVISNSVVKIFVTASVPNQLQPWSPTVQRKRTGSGCILSGNRILTNAHVISNCAFVEVMKAHSSRRFPARVAYVDHSSELALLTVETTDFFEDTQPIALGAPPEYHAQVDAYGFPSGGDDLAITAGVVSRIEVRDYRHSRRRLLSLQVDAALNPGSSGGPVVSNGQLIGIAFQARPDLDRSGYVIPVSVIERFLKDAEDGRIDGTPDLGVYWQKLENPGLRAWLGLSSAQSGVLISKVLFGSGSWGILRDGDVLTHVDGYQLSGDGSIRLRDRERLEFTHLITRKQIGENAKVDILRDRSPHQLIVPLAGEAGVVRSPQYSSTPSYFILAGLVFFPLTHEYLMSIKWETVNPRFKVYYVGARLPSSERRQVVFLSQVLAHEINAGYHNIFAAEVLRVNGAPIGDIRDVVTAAARPQGGFHVVELDHHGPEPSDGVSDVATVLAIEASSAASANAEILARYGIPADRSADLDL